MSISVKGVLPVIGIAGVALAAWLPVNTGNMVKDQFLQAIETNNLNDNTFRIEVLEYDKSFWSSYVVTRLILNDLPDGETEPSSVDIWHNIDHGMFSASFNSELQLTPMIRKTLELSDDASSPLRFDGEVTASDVTINTYLDRLTLKPDAGAGHIQVNPAIVQLDYDMSAHQYQLQATWNGAQLAAGNDELSVRKLSLDISGHKLTDLLWQYQSQLNSEGFSFGNKQFNLNSDQISLSDQFSIRSDPESAASTEMITYDSTLLFSSLVATQQQQPLLNMSPAEISYRLQGPDVKATEDLILASQQISSQAMSQQDADALVPVFSEFLQALELDIYHLNLVTEDGSVRGHLDVSLDASTQDLIQAFSFPPLLMQLLIVDSDLTISKSLVSAVMPLQILAGQLYQKQAYVETEDDMIVKTRMRDGQLLLNDVPF